MVIFPQIVIVILSIVIGSEETDRAHDHETQFQPTWDLCSDTELEPEHQHDDRGEQTQSVKEFPSHSFTSESLSPS